MMQQQTVDPRENMTPANPPFPRCRNLHSRQCSAVQLEQKSGINLKVLTINLNQWAQQKVGKVPTLQRACSCSCSSVIESNALFSSSLSPT